MIPKKCKNCCKQYFCKFASKEVENCKQFESWITTKNYGEVKRIKQKGEENV